MLGVRIRLTRSRLGRNASDARLRLIRLGLKWLPWCARLLLVLGRNRRPLTLVGWLVLYRLNVWDTGSWLDRLGCHRSLLLRLLDCLLVPLLQCLHLLLLFMTPMDRLADRAAYRTPYVLTSVIVTENVTRTNAVRDETFLVLTFCDMLPKPFHACTVGCYGTLSIFMLTFGCMAE